MTHSGGQQHEVGDRGQRYEITYFDPDDGERKIYGWSETPKGAASMGDCIDRHPTWELPQTRDRDHGVILHHDLSDK